VGLVEGDCIAGVDVRFTLLALLNPVALESEIVGEVRLVDLEINVPYGAAALHRGAGVPGPLSEAGDC